MKNKKINEAISQFKSIMCKSIFESLNNDKLIKIPDENSSQQELNFFETEINSLFNGSLYDTFVPEEYITIEGTRRDFDDYDEYSVNLQYIINEKEFWDYIYDKLYDYYDFGQNVNSFEIKEQLDSICNEIVEEAIENYEPSEDQLVHRGRDKGYDYWH